MEIKKPRKTTTGVVENFEKNAGLKAEANQSPKGLIAAIRIKGEVKVKPKIDNTLYRLRLRRKYSCVLINSANKGLMGMLWRVRHSVAYGKIDRETLVKLLEIRGKKLEKASSLYKLNENSKKAAKAVNNEDAIKELISGKNLEELGFKPFFRLHPPRKGIDSKLQYPKGVLGDNKHDINKLIERML